MTKDLMIKEDKKGSIETFFPPNPESSRLLVAVHPAQYAGSQIARAVEDADARLLNLNITSAEHAAGDVVIALRVSHRDPGRVARSLERYGYNVLTADYPAPDDNDTLRRRYDELMHILNL